MLCSIQTGPKGNKEMKKNPLLTLESEDSILKAADKLVVAANDLLRTAKTEEDLRIGFEKVLEPLCIGLGIKSSPRYEKSIYSGGRSDALHGLVIMGMNCSILEKKPVGLMVMSCGTARLQLWGNDFGERYCQKRERDEYLERE
jgi:hypothetical protein